MEEKSGRSYADHQGGHSDEDVGEDGSRVSSIYIYVNGSSVVIITKCCDGTNKSCSFFVDLFCLSNITDHVSKFTCGHTYGTSCQDQKFYLNITRTSNFPDLDKKKASV